MEVFKFNLRGSCAFFKKPEVNTYYYFTYGQIHKVALLGLFGAILGYKGYGAIYQNKKDQVKFSGSKEFPEFYQRLQGLKVSIVPNHKNGYISKKIQTFNNSVGYASKEQGGNLIVKEQWLENPSWDIYVLMNGEEALQIKDAIQSHQCVYQPYLGKNDHFADITNFSTLEGRELSEDPMDNIDSLFLKNKVTYGEEDEDSEVSIFKYEEFLPIGLEESTFMYKTEKFVFTNYPIDSYQGEVYEVVEETHSRKIAFF